MYFTVMEVHEWREAAQPVLSEAAASVHAFRYEETPHLTEAFLDLVATYCQMMLLISQWSDRKALLPLFARLHQTMRGSSEPSYSKVAQFAAQYEDCTKHLADDLRPCSAKVGQAVCALASDYTRLRDVQVLRKEGVFSATLVPAQMSQPTTGGFVQWSAANTQRFYAWILYGFLACPDELALSDALPLLRAVLQSAYVAPLVRDTVYYPHEEFDTLLDKHKNRTLRENLKKDKRLVQDSLQRAVGAATANGRGSWRERRIFVRQELSNLLALLHDQPGLAGPKFALALSLLSFARDEIWHHLRHLDSPLPKSAGGKRLPEQADPRLPELVQQVHQLRDVLLSSAPYVRHYYAEYLRGPHAARARELQQELQSKAPSAAGHVAEFVQAFQQARAEQPPDLSAARLAWLRAEMALASSGAGPLLPAMQRLALIARQTRYVDQLEACVEEAAGLRALYYWNHLLGPTFERALLQDLPSMTGAAASATYMRLLAAFPLNGTPAYTPEEREVIGPECVQIARQFLEKAVNRACQLLVEQVRQALSQEAQLAPENSAYPWLVKLKEWKPEKGFVPPVPPGIESEFRERARLESVRVAQSALAAILREFSLLGALQIYDHAVYPREFLRDSFLQLFRDFLSKVATTPAPGEPGGASLAPDEIVRPSFIERQVNAFAFTLLSCERHLEANLGEVLREAWLQQVHARQLGPAGSLDWAGDAPLDLQPSLARHLVQFYVDFISRRLTPTKDQFIYYSPARKCFISRQGMSFRAERYADVLELRSVCQLLGPYGVKLLDREVLRFISNQVASMREPLQTNRGPLEEMVRSYTKEPALLDALRRLQMPRLDALLAHSLALGNALHFRQLLHEALRLVTAERVPYIVSVVAAAQAQYPRNAFSLAEFAGVDALAKDLGLDVQTADHALKTALLRGAVGGAAGGGDPGIWNLLPVAHAAALAQARLWLEAEYRPALEAYTNNAGVLSTAIAELVTALRTGAGNAQADPREVTQALLLFVEISAAVLLRQLARAGAGSSSGNRGRFGLQSALIFLDRFVDASRFLTRDLVEQIVPYALLRAAYRDLYDVRAVGGKPGQEGEDHY